MEPRIEQPFNPLDKVRLAESVVRALLTQSVTPLPPTERFIAAGIYVIYYTGDFTPYRWVSDLNRDGRYQQPIYVGKAIPPGGRRGGLTLTAPMTTALYDRLQEHAETVSQATNLQLKDFTCRYLAVDEIWIPLAENLLIHTYRPLWNGLVVGFGNHDPGAGRYNQKRSAWDLLHPGRPWAERLQPHQQSIEDLMRRIDVFLNNPPIAEAELQNALGAEDDGGVV